MYGIILTVLILIILSIALCSKKNSVKKCNCAKCNKQRMMKQFNMRQMPEVQDSMQRGLFDMEQDTVSRGIVPYQNQPDHIANLWKCDYSHPKTLEGAGCLDTIFASDYPTPLRGSAVNQSVGDVSNMHLISRFATISS